MSAEVLPLFFYTTSLFLFGLINGFAYGSSPLSFRLTDAIIKETNGALAVRFNWEPAEGTKRYQLVVSEDGSFNSLSLREFTKNNSFLANTLKPETVYYWKVSAIYSKGHAWNVNGAKSFRTPALTVTKPQIIVPHGRAIIDGKIDPNEWKSAVSIVLKNFPVGNNEELENLPQGWLMWDNNNLYIAFKIWVTKGEKVNSKESPRDSMIHIFDSLEIFLYGPGRSKGYHFILNASNSIYDDYGGDTSFNGNWKHSTEIKNRYWQCEIAIPFSVIGEVPSVNSQWKAEFHANLNSQSIVPTWSGKTTPFGKVETFGTLILGK